MGCGMLDDSETGARSPLRSWLVWVLRIVAVAVVCIAVHRTAQNALAQLSNYKWHVRSAWIAAAGVVYVFGLLPMGWFWWRTLAALGCPTPLVAALSGYFLGHLGKYVPGKAMTVILRVAAVRRWVS